MSQTESPLENKSLWVLLWLFTKFFLRLLGIATILAVIVVSIFIYRTYTINYPKTEPFNEEVWKASTQLFLVGQDHPRRTLVTDLDHRLNRELSSKKQVLELLGPSDIVSRADPNSLGYAVGCGFTAPCFLDDDFFIVSFDAEGKFKSTYFIQD